MSAINFDSANFESKIEQGGAPALIDFWAPWCGPCKMLGPVIEQIADELEGKVIVGKINVDDNQQLAGKFGVMSIPTIIAFKDGKEVARSVGLVGKEKLLDMVKGL